MDKAPDLRLGSPGMSEAEKTDRVMRVVRPRVNFDLLSGLASLPDNVFYKTPTVREIPKPVPPPDYDQPNSDALAA